MGKKEDYWRRRREAKIFSYVDFHGRVYIACKECQNIKTCDHVSDGCMEGKIKDDLKKHL